MQCDPTVCAHHATTAGAVFALSLLLVVIVIPAIVAVILAGRDARNGRR